MNIQHTKLPLESFHWIVLKSSHQSSLLPLSRSLLFMNVQLLCTECDAIFSSFFFCRQKKWKAGALSLIKIHIIPQIQQFVLFFARLRYCLANTFIAKWYFIFICVQSSLRQFYLLVAKLHLSVIVEKCAMNFRHLFEYEFHWYFFFILFFGKAKNKWHPKRNSGKYHFWW